MRCAPSRRNVLLFCWPANTNTPAGWLAWSDRRVQAPAAYARLRNQVSAEGGDDEMARWCSCSKKASFCSPIRSLSDGCSARQEEGGGESLLFPPRVLCLFGCLRGVCWCCGLVEVWVCPAEKGDGGKQEQVACRFTLGKISQRSVPVPTATKTVSGEPPIHAPNKNDTHSKTRTITSHISTMRGCLSSSSRAAPFAVVVVGPPPPPPPAPLPPTHRARRRRAPQRAAADGGAGGPPSSAPGDNEVDAAAPAERTTVGQRRQQRFWALALADTTFDDEVRRAMAPVDWTPQTLLGVLATCLPAGGVAVLLNQRLATAAAAAASSSSSSSSGGDAVLDAAALHLAQEAVLAALLPAACVAAVGPRVIAAWWGSKRRRRHDHDPDDGGVAGDDGRDGGGGGGNAWLWQTLLTCALAFPTAEPLLWRAWQPVADAIAGSGGGGDAPALAAALHAAGAAGRWDAVTLHLLASAGLAPLWEEVFWRGFFLTALVRVLPPRLCVAASALNFAALHLSPRAFAPLLLLGASCDGLYLWSGGNLAAPLLLHSLWNAGQVLGVAVLGKEAFV